MWIAQIDGWGRGVFVLGLADVQELASGVANIRYWIGHR